MELLKRSDLPINGPFLLIILFLPTPTEGHIMRKFLEHNRYDIVLYSLTAIGALAVHQLSHIAAEKVWKSTLPLFEK